MSDETTYDHGFIRAWSEARDGRPACLDGQATADGRPALRFDFGTAEPGLRELSWDEFFAIFDGAGLALSFQEDRGQLSRAYGFVPRAG